MNNVVLVKPKLNQKISIPKIYYCIDNCGKIVKGENRRCKSCARKNVLKDPTKNPSFNKKLNKILTNNFLIKEYVNKNNSVLVISQKIGCSPTTIINRLNKFNIIIKGKPYKKGHVPWNKNLSKEKQPFYNKNLSKEHKEKISFANSGIKNGMYGKGIIGVQNKLYKHGKYSKINLKCIEKNCLNKVYKMGQRCLYHYNIWRRGSNHPNWQGGKSFEEYGSEFDNSLKEQVRFRDNYKCKLCGKPEVKNNRKLHVHHIDYCKTNNDVNNLITLCTSCHVRTNNNRNYWKEYFNEKNNIIKT